MGEPDGHAVCSGRGASNSKCHKAPLVPAVRRSWGEACFPGEDRGGRAEKYIGGPSLDSMREAVYTFEGVAVGGQ